MMLLVALDITHQIASTLPRNEVRPVVLEFRLQKLTVNGGWLVGQRREGKRKPQTRWAPAGPRP